MGIETRRVKMSVTLTTQTVRDLSFPRYWRIVRDTETHEIDHEFLRLEASGVRTAIRQRQAYGFKTSHWSLAVEFSTEAGTRPEEWYGFRRVNGELYSDADDVLTSEGFYDAERELRAAISRQALL